MPTKDWDKRNVEFHRIYQLEYSHRPENKLKEKISKKRQYAYRKQCEILRNILL